MELGEDEKRICEKYRARDANGRVQCDECPLATDIRWCVCKANITEEEWEEFQR